MLICSQICDRKNNYATILPNRNNAASICKLTNCTFCLVSQPYLFGINVWFFVCAICEPVTDQHIIYQCSRRWSALCDPELHVWHVWQSILMCLVRGWWDLPCTSFSLSTIFCQNWQIWILLLFLFAAETVHVHSCYKCIMQQGSLQNAKPANKLLKHRLSSLCDSICSNFFPHCFEFTYMTETTS